MSEPQRILSLFENLYNGDPWIEVTLAGTLSAISNTQAAAKKYPSRNSIWEITNHLIDWRLNVLKRVNGEVIVSPPHNYFLPVADTSAGAWQQTIKNLEASEQKWTEFLRKLDAESLSKTYPPNGHTYYEHIHGIIQHDAYHLGQIVLLAKHPD